MHEKFTLSNDAMQVSDDEAEEFFSGAAARPCAFCGAPDVTDVYAEEDYPDVPCCSDEAACYARMVELS